MSCFLLTAAQIALVNRHSVNFPNSDDFYTILLPLNRISSEQSWSAFAAAIFEPHTQHYQVLLRLAAFLVLEVFGAVDFKLLILIGSIWALPWLIVERRDPFKLLLLSCFLCQPLYSEPMLWATNAVPYLWINTFALLAFGARPVWSGLFSLLAVLSWGNGVFVPALLAALNLRQPRRLFCHLPALVIAVLLHLQNSSTVAAAAVGPGEFLIYTARLLGAAFAFYDGQGAFIVGAVLGCAALARIAAVLWCGGNLDRDIYLLAFLLLSSLSCAWFRAADWESSFTTSRYTLQSVLFAFLLLAPLLKSGAWRWPIILAGLFFCIHSNLRYFDYYRLRQTVVEEAALRWHLFGKESFCTGCDNYDQILKDARRLAVFSPAPQEFELASNLKDLPVAEPGQLEVQVEHLLSDGEKVFVSGYGFRRSQPEWQGRFYLLFKEGERRAAFECLAQRRIDVQLHLRGRGSYLNSGFRCLSVNSWPGEEAELYIVAQDKQGVWYSPLGSS